MNVATDHVRALLGAVRRNFELIAEHAKRHPAEASEIIAMIAAHVRNLAPMSMLDTTPILKLGSVAEISRELADGSKYTLEAVATGVYLHLSRPDAALLPIEIVRLRADLDAVGSR